MRALKHFERFEYSPYFPPQKNGLRLMDDGAGRVRPWQARPLDARHHRTSRSRTIKTILKTNIILSIKPQYVEEIIAGRKLFEFRKAIFKRKVAKVYIYASAPVCKVVGEFQPIDVIKGSPEIVWQRTQDFAGIKKEWYDIYYQGKTTAYAIAIKNLKIYQIPKELPFHAPQSFRYIESL